MQWTVPQIQQELAHLDVQMLSYIERCHMTVGCDKHKLKVLHRWVKAQTGLMVEILSELGTMYAAVHDQVLREQASAGISADDDERQWDQRYRPSDN